jgi:superfamily II DNA or RNA helicase
VPVDWSTALSDAEIRRATDGGAFARGLAYARAGHVVTCDFAPDTMRLTGVVSGSSERPYLVHVDLGSWARDAGSPRARGYATRCTCPVGGACKHTVAVMVVARERHTSSSAHGRAAWEHSLGALLPPRQGSGADRTPLALQLEVKQPPPSRYASATDGPGPRLHARPVIWGKSGKWVRSGITWHDLRFGAVRQRNVDPGALNLLHEFAQLESSGYSYVATQTVDLTLVRRSVWDLLDQAQGAGLALVQGTSGARPVELARDAAAMSLDVTRSAPDSDLLLRTRIEAGGEPVALADAHFLGRPAHGFFTEPAPVGSRLRLVRLERPLPDQVQRFVERVGALDIPAGDAARFLAGYWPRLRETVRITSSDASVALPEVTGPRLRLHVTFAGHDAATLTWGFTYEIDGAPQHLPLIGPAGDVDVRNPAAEAALLDRLQLPEEPVALRVSVGASVRLLPEQRLSGLDVLAFTEETLPLLRELPDLDVEVTGGLPTFRLTEVAPVVGVSATDTDDADWFDLGITVTIEGEKVPFVRLFAALAAGEPSLVLDSGTWFRLDRPELDILSRLIEEARELSDAPAKSLRINPFHAGLWDELVTLGVVDEQSQRWASVVGGLLGLDSLPTPAAPDGLRAVLRPYQLEGYRWLRFLHEHGLGGILADDMGLGKTVQTLALISAARTESSDEPPFLVVAPTSVVANWAAEAARFTPDLRVVSISETSRRRGAELADLVAGADLVVTSYALFRIDESVYQPLPWAGLLLDEAQFVKNHQAKTYQCARRLGAPFKLAITGTPLENNLMELWSLLSIVAPGMYASPKRFAEFFARPIERGDAPDRLAALRRRIRPLMLRRTKEQVATELPPKQEQVLPIELSSRHQRIYQTRLQRERQKVLRLIEDIDANRFTILRSLTTLRQLSLDPALVDDAHEGVGSAKTDALIELLTDVVGEGHRALVFSQFTGFLRRVRDRLDSSGIPYAYIDGRTRKRQQAIDAFKHGEAPVFVISLKAGGVGLNLTEADYVFVLDPWWNPAVEAQAVDRAHRIGQTKNVMVYRLVSQDTIETKVMELKARKEALFSSVMADDGGFSGALSANDIRGLFD